MLRAMFRLPLDLKIIDHATGWLSCGGPGALKD